MIVNPVVSGAISGGAKVVACGIIQPFDEPADIEFPEPVKVVVVGEAASGPTSNYEYRELTTYQYILAPNVGRNDAGPIAYVTADGLHLKTTYWQDGGMLYYVAFA